MNRVSENQCTVPLDQCQLVNTSKHAPQLSLRDEHCQGMVVIAATTATVMIVERFVNILRNQTICENCREVCQHIQESNHVKIVERFVNIFRNQTNCLRLGMVKWKECKWIDYCSCACFTITLILPYFRVDKVEMTHSVFQ